jgi:hypothetical protein
MNEQLPITPYNGTGGHAGTDTSRDRAELEVADGTLAERQQKILDTLEAHGSAGATWNEIGRQLYLHHGQVSGALSNLHSGGHVFMLKERRNRSHPYVHAKFRDRWREDERHDSPRQTRAGDRKRLADDLLALCREGVERYHANEDDSWQAFTQNSLEFMDMLVKAIDRLDGRK